MPHVLPIPARNSKDNRLRHALFAHSQTPMHVAIRKWPAPPEKPFLSCKGPALPNNGLPLHDVIIARIL